MSGQVRVFVALVLCSLTMGIGWMLFGKWSECVNFSLVVAEFLELYLFFNLPFSEYLCDQNYYKLHPNHGIFRLGFLSFILLVWIIIGGNRLCVVTYFLLTLMIDSLINDIIDKFKLSRKELTPFWEKEKSVSTIKIVVLIITALCLFIRAPFGH